MVAPCDNVAHCRLFCVHHQGHLILKSLLKVLDTFSCGDDDIFQLSTRYFTGVASISSVWRSTGAQRSRIPQCDFSVKRS